MNIQDCHHYFRGAPWKLFFSFVIWSSWKKRNEHLFQTADVGLNVSKLISDCTNFSFSFLQANHLTQFLNSKKGRLIRDNRLWEKLAQGVI